MGFGILFIGYIFTLFDTGPIFSDALGYLFMLGLSVLGWTITSVGLFKLKKYISAHERAFSCSVSMILISLIRLTAYTLLKLNILLGGFTAGIITSGNIFSAVMLGAFFRFLLTGISQISLETELPAYSKSALKLRTSALVFTALDIVSCINLGKVTESLSSVRFLYYIVLVILVAASIFKCYMRICLPEDLEMLPKERKKFFEKNREDNTEENGDGKEE